MNHFRYIIIILFILVPACSRGIPEGAVDNSITGPVDTLHAALEIGREIGDSTEIFGSIVDAGIDGQGRIFVLDEIACCLKVYDMQGSYLQQVSRRGAGPGECLRPRGMFIMPDGRVGICASDKAGWVVFDSSLEYLEEVSHWMENSPYDVTPITDDRLAVCRYDEYMADNQEYLRQSVALYNRGAPECATFLWRDTLAVNTSDVSSDISDAYLFAFSGKPCVGGSGNGAVYIASRDPFTYCVTGWDSSGTQILEITGDMSPVEKTAEEIAYEAQYLNQSNQSHAGRRIGFDIQPHPYRSMITCLGIGPDGNLWVRRGTRSEPFFDIYDLEGMLLRHSVFPDDSWTWETVITPYGVLAWELDPLEGYQRMYLLK